MKDRLIDGYLDWLRPCDELDNFQQLLLYLNTIPFKYKREMDANQLRHADELRERIAAKYNIKYNYFVPASVLEVLLSLADRFSTVLFVPGDTQFDGFIDIFRLFLDNLGLNLFDDDNFDQDKVSNIIEKWLNLEYNKDGTQGNIVVKPGYNKLKSLDMWMQLNKVLIPNYDSDEPDGRPCVR